MRLEGQGVGQEWRERDSACSVDSTENWSWGQWRAAEARARMTSSKITPKEFHHMQRAMGSMRRFYTEQWQRKDLPFSKIQLQLGRIDQRGLQMEKRCMGCLGGSVGWAAGSRFQLGSWSHGSWVWALHQAPCWQCRAYLGFSFSPSVSTPPLLTHALSLSQKQMDEL